MKNSVLFLKRQNILSRIEFCLKLLSLSLIVLSGFSGCRERWEIHNPYDSVDWGAYRQYKAEFHAHTTRSDGSMNPQSVVDMYHKNGYHILAITDHDRVTYPWDKFSEMEPSDLSVIRMEYGLSGEIPENSSHAPRDIHLLNEDFIFKDRDPSAMGMVSIMGNEISGGQHDMGSYFNDYLERPNTEEESLKATSGRNGLAMFMHPERYNYSVQWYLDFYQRYDHLIGLELFNSGTNLRHLDIWDSLLVILMPERPVWGFSNADMHRPTHFGQNWNIMILPELSEKWVRKGMERGLSFWVYASEGRYDNPVTVPVIESIKANSVKGTIDIQAYGQDSVVWISGGSSIHQGNKIDVSLFPDMDRYVRAVLYNDGGGTLVGTQPFGVKRL